MTTTAPPLDQRGAAFALAVLDAVAKAATARLKDGRAFAAGDYLAPGDRVVVRDPDSGDQLGLVWMTRPSPIATVTNRDVFTSWQAEEDPDSVEESMSIRAGALQEALTVLAEHAPHVLHVETTVKDYAEAHALKHATTKGAAPIPGVEVRTPRGTVTVKLDKDGPARLLEMVSDGVVDPLRELPSAHHCLRDASGGFPDGLPDVGRDGLTGDGAQGPFDHACALCGKRFGWRDVAGFVIWTPLAELPAVNTDGGA